MTQIVCYPVCFEDTKLPEHTQCCSRGFWSTCSSPTGLLGRCPWSWTFSSWGMSSKVSLYQREHCALIFSYFPLEQWDWFLPTVKMCNGSDGRFFPGFRFTPWSLFIPAHLMRACVRTPTWAWSLKSVSLVSDGHTLQRHVNATQSEVILWTKCCMMQLLLGVSLVTGSLG